MAGNKYIRAETYDLKGEPGPREIALRFVEQHYAERLTIERVATECGMNGQQFITWFARDFGQTFRQYLEHYRIEQARLLLRSGFPCVAEVAFRVGFSELPRFVDLFEKQVGVAPVTYRDRD